MPPKKSIYRQSGAQHFQLVHRSQRDPLIHDPDASQHVLKPFHRENDIKKVSGNISQRSKPVFFDIALVSFREKLGQI